MKRWYTVDNGGLIERDWEGFCNRCGNYIHESYPHEELGGSKILCADCSFIKGYWDEKTYLMYGCLGNTFIKRAAVKDGKIYTTDKKFPWEKAEKEQRNDGLYAKWRNQVYERDNYTCKICGQRGGRLNAHHIKPFAKFPQFRLDISNGVTMCEKCHIRVHKEKDSEWIYSD